MAVASTSERYQERLWLPWWAWPVALGLVAALAAELTLGLPSRSSEAMIGAVVLAGLALAWTGRLPVAVTAGPAPHLRVDDAALPVRFVAGAAVLDQAQLRLLLGPQADPLAFVVVRPWIRTAVRVDLDDPADPTPYWVISTRHPERLVAALQATAG